MKRTVILLALALAAAGAFSGCGNSSSSSSQSSSAGDVSQPGQGEESSANAGTVAEPDFMGMFVGDGGKEYIGMSLDEMNSITDNAFTEEKAAKYDDYDGVITCENPLGRSDTMLGGRVKLSKEYDQTLKTEFKDNTLKAASIRIEKITKEEAEAICDAFIAAFDGKLPEGYEKFPVSERGKTVEVGFTKSVDDYVLSMTRSEDLDGDYYVFFEIQIYAERYGMK